MTSNNGPEEGVHEDETYRPDPPSMPAYMDVPTCVACGSAACVPGGSYGKEPDDLVCSVCRWTFIGTPEQLEQARRAEQAWNTRTDDSKGPWTRVLRRRARGQTDQIRLFGGESSR